ncbi:hypothetical protein ABBQ32_003049 [Trebouxia sp. C0010 RCD-2024]
MEEPYDYDAEALQGERSNLLAVGNNASTKSYADLTQNKVQLGRALDAGLHHSDSNAIAAALHIPAHPQGAQYALSELDQFDKMINWMLITYFGCLGVGWGLLLFDWVWNKAHKLHSQVQLQLRAHSGSFSLNSGECISTSTLLVHPFFSGKLAVARCIKSVCIVNGCL